MPTDSQLRNDEDRARILIMDGDLLVDGCLRGLREAMDVRGELLRIVIAHCTYSALYQLVERVVCSPNRSPDKKTLWISSHVEPRSITKLSSVLRTKQRMTTHGSRHVHIGCPAHGTFGLNLESLSYDSFAYRQAQARFRLA